MPEILEKEKFKITIFFCSNGRRGSRQLGVKDFGVIKEDEEHSEVILSFLDVKTFGDCLLLLQKITRYVSLNL